MINRKQNHLYRCSFFVTRKFLNGMFQIYMIFLFTANNCRNTSNILLQTSMLFNCGCMLYIYIKSS
ncbi:hypothetical protein OIU79_025943 [Salix purpurea]|uniref:Uncharacterized protein n=1 Tax=Salix purpurea TaxID=77065 RepID=A0A9Q0W6A1_SALPP|nr:hypothetical protein OIU79_025943 [Salix purpurea]